MSKEILMFGVTEIEKNKFYRYKSPNLSNKISFSE